MTPVLRSWLSRASRARQEALGAGVFRRGTMASPPGLLAQFDREMDFQASRASPGGRSLDLPPVEASDPGTRSGPDDRVRLRGEVREGPSGTRALIHLSCWQGNACISAAEWKNPHMYNMGVTRQSG